MSGEPPVPSSRAGDVRADVGHPRPPRWPSGIAALLDGTALGSKIGPTFQLVTVDPDGWPRIASLSAGELLVTGADMIAVALWPSSRTTANMLASRRCSLAFAHDGATWLGRLTIEASIILDIGEKRTCFKAQLVDLRRDAVPYAEVTSGTTFRLTGGEPVTERWERTLSEMRRQLIG